MANSALNVLHVEDDYFDAALIKEMLHEGSGGQVINLKRVNSLKEAVNDLDKNQYNVILLDLILGDVSGIRNVEVLSGQCPDTPIVVLTGIDGFDSATRAIKAGAQEYLVKAYENSHTLRYAIKSAIERKEYEKELYRKVNYDTLTGLPNHNFLNTYLQKEITKAKRWQKEVALMLVDIYQFRKINDHIGFENGNHILREVADRIKSTLRGSDSISRYGKDEFAIIPDINNSVMKTGCAQIAGKIINAMKDPVEIDNKKIAIPINIGVSFYPHDGTDHQEILDAADKATFRAKNSGPNIYKFA